jgi:D-alanyl-D-alanine carboxypeptidase
LKNRKPLIFLAFLFLGSLTPAWAAQKKAKSIKAPLYAAIVIDADTGYVWHEENADSIVHPASLTKIMACLILFEALEQKKIKLNSRMPISTTAANQAPCKLGLKPGKTLLVMEALIGMVTKSANDAAVVVSEYLGGTTEQFVKLMNAKARSLGMKDTVFKNPTGLPNKEQVTSARDMAILSRALLQKFPHHYRYFKTRAFTYNGQVHKNHNHLLGKVPGVDGIKTGFVAASGFNLAASAKRNGKRLIAVVMGGKSIASRDKRVAELLEQGFYMAFSGKPVQQSVYVAQNTKNLSQGSKSLRKEETLPPVKKALLNSHSLFTSAHASDFSLKESRPKNWLVQVGAYKQAKLATSKINQVIKKYHLVEGKPAVAVTKRRHKKIFQARVVNLTQKQAQQTCQVLHKKGEQCIALKNISRRINLAMNP